MATGIVETGLIIGRLSLAPVLLIAGLMTDPTASMSAGRDSGGVLESVLEGVSGVLMGPSVILVVVASVKGDPKQ